MDEINNEASTSDIYLAAAYLALGATYEGVDKSNPRQMIFKFSSRSETSYWIYSFSEIERDWINSTLEVNAKKYKEAIQNLKSIVHNGRSNGL